MRNRPRGPEKMMPIHIMELTRKDVRRTRREYPAQISYLTPIRQGFRVIGWEPLFGYLADHTDSVIA
jgi:hypothetical protein